MRLLGKWKNWVHWTGMQMGMRLNAGLGPCKCVVCGGRGVVVFSNGAWWWTEDLNICHPMFVCVCVSVFQSLDTKHEQYRITYYRLEMYREKDTAWITTCTHKYRQRQRATLPLSLCVMYLLNVREIYMHVLCTLVHLVHVTVINSSTRI